MKIIGHTPEGDLIIQVSQAGWVELQNGRPPTAGPLAFDVLLKERKALKRRKGYEKVVRGIGCITRDGSILGWSFDDFVTELHKPDSEFLDKPGIGQKSLDILRKHFSEL